MLDFTTDKAKREAWFMSENEDGRQQKQRKGGRECLDFGGGKQKSGQQEARPQHGQESGTATGGSAHRDRAGQALRAQGAK